MPLGSVLWEKIWCRALFQGRNKRQKFSPLPEEDRAWSGALREDAGGNSEGGTMGTVTLHYMWVRDHVRLATGDEDQQTRMNKCQAATLLRVLPPVVVILSFSTQGTSLVGSWSLNKIFTWTQLFHLEILLIGRFKRSLFWHSTLKNGYVSFTTIFKN